MEPMGRQHPGQVRAIFSVMGESDGEGGTRFPVMITVRSEGIDDAIPDAFNAHCRKVDPFYSVKGSDRGPKVSHDVPPCSTPPFFICAQLFS
jgi:hypothetical protein